MSNAFSQIASVCVPKNWNGRSPRLSRRIRLPPREHAKTAACTPRFSHFPKALLTEPNFLGAPNLRLCYIVSYSTLPRVKQIDVKFVSGLRRVYVGSMSGAPRFCSILQRLALPPVGENGIQSSASMRERISSFPSPVTEETTLTLASPRPNALAMARFRSLVFMRESLSLLVAMTEKGIM